MALRDLPIGRLLAAFCVLLLAVSVPAAAQAPVDTTPSGMVAFFTAPDPTTGACPAGWFVPPQAQGRLMVGLGNTGAVGVAIGTAMANATDPTHAHSYAPSITLPDRHVSAGVSGSDRNGALNGTHTMSPAAVTDPSPSNLPFIQLIVCQKQ